ncbi:hypothetical protein M3Y95_00831600 [Aphelenchoides besseyi]|nr:hypothetical protein M3Y95_00831600 [Aphelenchoides besseyi]
MTDYEKFKVGNVLHIQNCTSKEIENPTCNRGNHPIESEITGVVYPGTLCTYQDIRFSRGIGMQFLLASHAKIINRGEDLGFDNNTSILYIQCKLAELRKYPFNTKVKTIGKWFHVKWLNVAESTHDVEHDATATRL